MDGADPVEPTWGPPSKPPSVEDPDIARINAPRRRMMRMILVVIAMVLVVVATFVVRAKLKDRALRHSKTITIPTGTFTMGSDVDYEEERPAHSVNVYEFEIDETEVTVAAYRLCVDAGVCSPPVTAKFCNFTIDGRDEHPVNCVDFHQATTFCAWADKRLPTEEEWEHAARGNDGRRYPWGNELPDAKRANVADLEARKYFMEVQSQPIHAMLDESDGWSTTAKVGSFPAGVSPFGVKDMSGNVFEWTNSPYCTYPDKRCESIERVARGGSWLNAHSSNVRAAARDHEYPDSTSDQIGFRCATNAR